MRPVGGVSEKSVTAGGIALSAAWFALFAGLTEVAILGVRKFLLHHTLFVDPRSLWMTPVSYLGLFLVIALAVLAVRLAMGTALSLRPVVFLFATLAAFSVLFLFHPRLHKAAILLLALGIGTQTARLVASNAAAWNGLVRRTVAALLALVVILCVGWQGWHALAEGRAIAALPPARAGAPNVLLIILDTVRAWSLSLYGYPRPTTPNLDRLAKQGVVFDRAISTAPWTLPSHGSVFTGRFPHELSADWDRPLDGTAPTLAELLRSRGYVTAGFVANTRYCIAELGLGRGFVHYEDFPLSLGELVLSSSLGRFITNNPVLRRVAGSYELLDRKPAATINRDFLDWLDRSPERPFFVFLNYFDAHEPYLPP